MLISTSQPAINLKERGIQIDLRALEEHGPAGSDHLAVLAPPRSGGVHCSSLIRSIAINTGKLKLAEKGHGSRFKMDAVIDERDFPLVMAMGMAWEDWLSRQYPDMLYHIGELSLDGISMSPDGVTVDMEMDPTLGMGIVEEFKFTYKSSRKPIEEQWMWLAQVKAYCKALPTLCARLHVLHANGDYDYARPGLPPQYIVHSLQFTQRELDSNWNMLVKEKDDLECRGIHD